MKYLSSAIILVAAAWFWQTTAAMTVIGSRGEVAAFAGWAFTFVLLGTGLAGFFHGGHGKNIVKNWDTRDDETP
jgi:hypothetical protein